MPDGSTIVLHAGSTIDYPTEFTGKTREISLVGEAYFDIKHDPHKPFIIHTGKVKTTVLGTAFNIKAWPNRKNIIVSVTRGKVRVENEKKVLAVLTINQEIKYNLQSATIKQHEVNAEKIVNDWTKQDLNFDACTLESIAQMLSKRFGKDIIITSPNLAKTQIVSSFSGTESLHNILDILCTINANTEFIEKDNKVIISSKN
ncbi:FecR domain-containing protein [uncultured Bacteroides sp.]|uniref:FecR family protein n=1 Tax=uncultured Bacteroides sp. TaxID=162156 RepID=UPI002AAB5F48|nr:FecR domain-containing protein [uncultured Bacteroides sp.]